MPIDSADPRKPARVAGRWPAVTLAIAVHVVFIAVLVFSVRWQNKPPEPVVAELYAPPTRTPAVEPPVPKPVPKPAPEPEPAVEPAPAPKPVIKPPPPIEQPDPRAAEIALKAKQDEERRRREQAELDRREAERKDVEKREAEKKRQDEQKRVAEARERQVREAEALKAQAQRETQLRTQQQAERDAQIRAQQAERDARILAQQQQASARARALDEYIQRIRMKVRANVIEPGEISGNPEAIFEVVQLPTGDIIEVKLRKSSGVRAYDDAVQRAIIKSSPLPRPTQPDLWERVLELRFKPRE
jgi:colicin import membrane protein